MWWKSLNQCNRRTTTWYWKSRSSPSLTDKQILIEGKIDNYVITNLPYEIIEMILVDAVNSSNNSIKTYNILSQTCSRFKKKTCTSHMKFLDSVFDSFHRFYDKVKVSLWKVMKKFDPETGVATSLTEIFDDKKWRFTWVSALTLANMVYNRTLQLEVNRVNRNRK